MKARHRRRAALAAAVLALASTAGLRAVHADDRVPVRIDYQARPGCPDADAFVREVLSRAPRARLATSNERSRSLVARVKSGARGLEGVLAVRDVDGAASERAVHAQSCEELVTALAVIAAVVIDPLTARTGANAGATPGGEAGAAPLPDGGAPAAATSATAADAAGAAPAVAGSSPPPELTAARDDAGSPPDAERPEPPSEGPSEAPTWKLSAGAGVGVVGGTAPTVLLSVPVFVEVSRALTGILEPTARFRFERTAVGTTSREGGGGGASFVRTGGAADLCPIAVRARSLRAQPCLRAELAAMYAKGLDVSPARDDLRPWFALGPVARLRIDIVGPLFAELEGALLVAVIRDRFFVEPSILVYRPPAVGATTAFALGLAF